MSDATIENPGLRLKIRPSKAATSTTSMSETRAWGIALPRISEKAISLVAGLSGFTSHETDLEAVLTGWDETTLGLMLEGPAGRRGLAQLDAAMIAALTESQTIGRVLDTEIAPRPATNVDAAICDHMVTAWCAGAAQAMEGAGETPWVVGERIQDPRAAKVALEDGDYRVTEISMLFGGGARTGVLRMLYPLSRPKLATPGSPSVSTGREAVLSVPAELEAILHRTHVPLAWLRGLEVGAILEIPRNAIEHVRLETTDGRRVARAHLGRSGEFRAVRLLADDAPDTIGRDDAGNATFESGGAAPAPAALGLPGAMGMDDLPGGGIVDLPDAGGLPDLEGEALPDLGGGLPDLGGGLPDLGGGGLPDLSEEGGLPDLPELGSLPVIE